VSRLSRERERKESKELEESYWRIKLLHELFLIGSTNIKVTIYRDYKLITKSYKSGSTLDT